MSLESDREESLLHRYFDGELEAGEAGDMSPLLSARADLRAELERMGEIRSLLRESIAKDTADIDSDELFARIETGVERARERAERPRVVSIHTRRAKIAVFAATAALAAALLLAVLRPTESPVIDDDDSLATGSLHTEETPESEVAAVETVFQTEVIEVDFGENSGAIFAIEGEDGERHAVVWLADIQPKGSVIE